MTVVESRMAAPPETVFAILRDGWLLPLWVVGATHVRDVDAAWPEPGSCVHHKVGAWPMMLADSTEVVECEPPHRLVLQARAWPLGEARVVLTIEAAGAGSLVRMAEAPSHGAARTLDNPVQRWMLAARNRECLSRLAAIAQHRGQR
jgi:uncharacterized protein YndB with AHSA1/START domain